MTRRVLAAAALGAVAAGYLAGCERHRRLSLRRDRWPEQAAAAVSRSLEPGWRAEAVNVIAGSADGSVEAWRVRRGGAPEVMFTAPPVPDDARDLEGER